MQARRFIAHPDPVLSVSRVDAALRAAGLGRIFGRVLQQIGEDAFQHAGVAMHPGLRRQVGGQAQVLARPGNPPQGLHLLAQQRHQVDRIKRRALLTRFVARHRQQGGDAAIHPTGCRQCDPQRLGGSGWIIATKRVFCTGPDFSQRRAQLVGHITRKTPFAFGGGVQPLQGLVQCADEGCQFARQGAGGRWWWLARLQRPQPFALFHQWQEGTPHQQQAQHHRHRHRSGDDRDQGQVDAPLGQIPGAALGGDYQPVRCGGFRAWDTQHDGAARMTIGQEQIVMA